MSKVIWQQAALPSCYPSRQRMDSSDLDSHQIPSSLDPLESAFQMASRSVQPFLYCSQPQFWANLGGSCVDPPLPIRAKSGVL